MSGLLRFVQESQKNSCRVAYSQYRLRLQYFCEQKLYLTQWLVFISLIKPSVLRMSVQVTSNSCIFRVDGTVTPKRAYHFHILLLLTKFVDVYKLIIFRANAMFYKVVFCLISRVEINPMSRTTYDGCIFTFCGVRSYIILYVCLYKFLQKIEPHQKTKLTISLLFSCLYTVYA